MAAVSGEGTACFFLMVRSIHQRHVGQSLVGLDGGHRHRRLQGLVGLQVDADALRRLCEVRAG
jgi:hypothetical protein